MKKAGITPVIQQLDNETSKELIEAIEEKQLQYQLVPPGNHQTQPAKGTDLSPYTGSKIP